MLKYPHNEHSPQHPERAALSIQKQRDNLAQNPDKWGISTQYEAPVVLLKKWVDFHYENNGQTFEFSIPGGGYSRLSDIVRLLCLAYDDPETTEDEVGLFVQDVADVTFSAPELLWVGKVEHDTTVKALKDAYGLVCEYSGELTSHDIRRIDEATVASVDWALISLKPFESLESLTVSMEDGTVYKINVTDGQIVKRHIDDSGNTWKITVIYGEDAEIPEGAELEVEELLPGRAEYEKYYSKAMAELGVTDMNPVEADTGAEAVAAIETIPVDETSVEGIRVSLPLTENRSGNTVEFARFFDIRILHNGNQIEPKAPVIVKAEYADMPEMKEGDTVTAVHFAESGVELIDTDTGDTTEEIFFEQGSFSVTGTVVTSNQNWSNLSNGKYVMYITSGGKTYAVKHDRSLTEVSIENGKLVFPTFTVLSDVDEYLWDYQASYSGGYSGSWRHYLFYTTGGTQYYIDPQAANDISTAQRDLSRTGDGKIYSSNNYLGVSGGNIVGQRNSSNGVPIQFANAFELVTDRSVTVHFVDRAGNPLQGVNYTGGNGVVTLNNDGTYSIPYNWHGQTGSVHLDTDFSKAGYTYANTHLAGTRQGTALTYNGLVIDEGLVENGYTLHYFTDNGDEGSRTGNLKFNKLKDFDLNAAMQVYYTNTNGTAVLGDYSPANAESKDIYVILDPIRAGTGGSGSGSGSGSAGGDIDVNDPDFLKTMEPNGDGTYTISLSVTGKAKNQTVNPKANVVLVVDTSSSMDNPHLASNSRLNVTKAALSGENGISKDLFKNNGTNGRDDDTVEVAMITFDGAVVTSNDWMKTQTVFDAKVNGLTEASLHRGTDWEDALKEAYTLAYAKMNEPGHKGEPTFIIFFTDGEPSQYTQFHGTGDYNESNPNHSESGYRVWYSYFLSREAAKDEARAIVNDGIRLYGIFAFNSGGNYEATGETGSDLLKNTIGYAYNMSSVPDNTYFYNAGNQSALTRAFDNILKSINESIGISNVQMHDDITGLTSVGISTAIEGNGNQYSGFKYTRSGGSYGLEQEWTDAPSAVFVENFNPDNPASSKKYVEWDLGSAETLEDGVTYTVSFTVWPSQEAYNLVADLNNGIRTWDSLSDEYKKQVLENPAGSGKYELKTNPSSAEGYNEITYDKVLTEILDELPPGVQLDTPVTEGNVTTVYTKNEDKTYTVTITTHKTTAFNDPEKNMKLEDTISKVMKKWISDLQLKQLVEYLYDTQTGESKEMKIPFILNQDTDIYGNAIWLGWDQQGTGTGYTWSDTTQKVSIGEEDNSREYTIGTEWTRKFDIAVGLALDKTHAEARRIDLTDTTKYTKVMYNNEPLYILEPGHDYYINEPAVAALLGYRFDFSTRIYHPMLLNGVLKSVTIEDGVVKDVYPGGMQALGALVGENILRGGINLHKILWDDRGKPIPVETQIDDEFEFTITLVNTSLVSEKVLEGTVFVDQPPHNVFVGEDIPWYSVNGNYYHDDDGNYYSQDGEGRSGNIMNTEDGQTATVTLRLKRTDTVRIANIPAGTTFTVVETPRDDYDFVSASRGVTGTTVYNLTVNAPSTPSIGGKIVPNKEMNVAFTNQKVVKYHIDIIKKNMANNEVLSDAVFALYGSDYYVKDGQGQPTSTVNPESVPLKENLISDESGVVNLGELISNVYYLVETQAPEGFLKTAPIRIKVDRESTITKIVDGEPLPLYVIYHQDDYSGSDDYSGIAISVSTTETDDGTVTTYSYALTVMNNPGAVLPSTGGPGTRNYTILGSLLIAGSGLLLFRRRRWS